MTVIGDGRCHSLGFSAKYAKYCTYTMMWAVSSAIFDFQVIKVAETGSSSRMELEGFKLSFASFTDNDINIKTFCSDWHVQIRNYIKDELPYISRQFDVWHLANIIRNKSMGVAKKKENKELMPWVRSIVNHVWYCAAECREDLELLIEKCTSILQHIQNIHFFDGDKHFACGHPQISSEQTRKKIGFRRKTNPTMFEKIVMDKRIQTNIRQLNHFVSQGKLICTVAWCWNMFQSDRNTPNGCMNQVGFPSS